MSAPSRVDASGVPTRALSGVLDARVSPGPTVACWLAGQGGVLRDLASGLPHLADGPVVAFGDGRVQVLRHGPITVVGVFDLRVGRAEDALEGVERRCWVAWRGRFAFVRHDVDSGEWCAVVDHFGTLPLFHTTKGEQLLVASRLQPLLKAPWVSRRADPAAVFHFLNFACIPAPLTIVADVQRLPPASLLRWRAGKGQVERWWRPTYAEDLDGDAETLAGGLRERMVTAIERCRPPGDARWGTFLSGGTDSSSITTVLARQVPGEDVHSFSIGFAEAGYDELEFARVAASACGARGHFGSIDEAETLAVLPHLPELFDQPFGNASAVPTLACAAMAAADGRSILVAGDGGDEIFGGNERYAKDMIMQRWFKMPGAVKSLGRAVGRTVGGGSNRFLNRIDNFARRSSLPNPDRFYTDDAFASECFDELLTASFRSTVTADLSLQLLRGLYAGCDARSELHRLMALDLELAIAQNDLVKVDGAARHTGVTVRFPYLDADLVDYTGRLKAHWKVRGTQKRVLFKQATRGILPEAILKKPKQGFGLPISVWMRDRPAFREWLRDLLLSERTRQRGWFEPAYVADLFNRHQAGGWDYSAHLWSLAVLELWVRNNLEGDVP
ncbi:MAG: asparagine synthetase B family protein [Silanimonas sp.]